MATQIHRLAGLMKSAYSASRLNDEADGELLARCRTGADPAAFEAIVRRHGPIVLAACRKVLTEPADIDDAFQATFLTLLQKPAALRNKNALGSWLYGVAHRTALRARNTSARRLAILQKVTPPPASSGGELSWKEACDILHDELDRLPDSLRLPLMHCYLEGLSRDEAARRLGWSLNEVRGRLERGRLRLRARLERRGIALSAGLLAAASAADACAKCPSTRLVTNLIQAAADGPSPAVGALIQGSKIMTATKMAALSFVVLAGVALVGLGRQEPALSAGQQSDVPKPAAKAAETKNESWTFEGRVEDADKKPIEGATIHLLYYTPKIEPIPERAKSDDQGRFRFELRQADYPGQHTPWKGSAVLVQKTGYAIAYAWRSPGKAGDLTVRLEKVEKPLRGRVVNLEGQGVADVTVRLDGLVEAAKGRSLEKLASEIKQKQVGLRVERDHATGLEGTWIGRDLSRVVPTVRTAKDGSFEFPGIGTNQLAVLSFESPAVERKTVRVLPYASDAMVVGEWEPTTRGSMMRIAMPTVTYVGRDFKLALAPGRTVTGFVKDASTGKPILGARVQVHHLATIPNYVRSDLNPAITDADGRYTIHGLPLGRGNVLLAAPPPNGLYLRRTAAVPAPIGATAATLDFAMAPGVELICKPADADTGKPLDGFAHFYMFGDDRSIAKYPGLTFPNDLESNVEGGQVRMVVPPGKGIVAFRATADRYPIGVGADHFKELRDRSFIRTQPSILDASNYNLVMEVEAKAGTATVVDLKLAAGRTVRLRAVSPDGKPLEGVHGCGLGAVPSVFGQWERSAQKSPDFKATGIVADQPRLVIFQHLEKKLAGSKLLSGNVNEPIDVKLAPWGSISGRLVDDNGKPQAGVRLVFTRSPEQMGADFGTVFEGRELRTDEQGRFRIEGFTSGVRYNVAALRDFFLVAEVLNAATFEAGEAKDLGDIKTRSAE